MSHPNDNFANATVLTGSSGTATFDLTSATAETGEPEPASGMTVWFSWTAPFSGTVWFDTMLSTGDPDTYLSVYTGGSVGSLTLVTDDDDSGNDPAVGDPDYGTSKLSFTAVSGTTYNIQVDAYDPGVTGTLRWGTTEPLVPLPPPPAPTAGAWSSNSGLGSHVLRAGDEATVAGTHLDVLDGVTVGGVSQSYTVTSSIEIVVRIDGSAASGPIVVSNSSGSDPASGDAEVWYAGPWIQPADVEMILPQMADTAYGPADSTTGANVAASQPDIEGDARTGPGFTSISVANISTGIDTTGFDWHVYGGLVLARGYGGGLDVPPLSTGPIYDANPDALLVEMESDAGVPTSDVAVKFLVGATLAGEWRDDVDDKSPTDLSGDLWQTHLQYRRLATEDWVVTFPSFPAVDLVTGTWPSKTWIAALDTDLDTSLFLHGEGLDISTDEFTGVGGHLNNVATHIHEDDYLDGVTLTFAEYLVGLAWLVVLDRMVDQPTLTPPVVDAGSIYTRQTKFVDASAGLHVIYTYRPPRYRLYYASPPATALVALRQVGRPDASRQYPRAHVDRSRQTGRIP